MINFRALHGDDLPFIYNSWIKSIWDDHKKKRGEHRVGEKTRFFDVESVKLERMMRRSSVLVCCDPEDASHIYGYVVYEGIAGVSVVHFIYLKQPFRKMGLAKRMLEHLEFKEHEPLVISYENKKLRGMKWNYNLVAMPKLREI